jgi:succinate dehydrogenase/fumarate reductase cytochrome b subunit
LNVTLQIALLAAAPVSMLVIGSAVVFLRTKTGGSFMQLVGAVCLMIVVLVHVFEALRLLPWMGWGLPHSIGHYIDLGSAVLGLTLFPIGFLSHALARR